MKGNKFIKTSLLKTVIKNHKVRETATKYIDIPLTSPPTSDPKTSECISSNDGGN